VNNSKNDASRHFRNKKREYLKDKINNLAANRKDKNIRDLYRGINGFKKGYRLRINLVQDKIGYMLAASHNILNGWKNYFSQLLNVYRIIYVRQIIILSRISVYVANNNGFWIRCFDLLNIHRS
jgi:hypothetical protein